jgi:hypothetical protein
MLGILTTAAALLGVVWLNWRHDRLVLWLRAHFADLAAFQSEVRAELADIRAEVGEIRRQLDRHPTNVDEEMDAFHRDSITFRPGNDH